MLLAGIVTANNITSRFIFRKSNLSSRQIAADSSMVQAIFFLMIFLVSPKPYNSVVFWFIAIGSLMGTIGVYLITEAVIHGKAGPTQALVECQTLWCLFLEVTILSKVPNTIQLVAFLFGIIGGLCIAQEKSAEETNK